ncbi:unnamed protein product, partial [Allacma fusca]
NAWDEDRKLIYFLAIPATAPKERRFYRLRVEQPFTEHVPDCVSCPTIASTEPLPATRIATKENKTTGPPPTLPPMPNKQSQGPKKNRDRGSGGKNFGGDSNPTSASGDPNVYNLDGADPKKSQVQTGPWVDLQGNVLFGENISCSFVTTVKFSPNKTYVTLECGGPGIPFVTLATVDQSNLRLIQVNYPPKNSDILKCIDAILNKLYFARSF